MSDNIIQINNMNKWFGDFQVLKGINLEVKPKQKIVVCGPSGSGKSTLIRCIIAISLFEAAYVAEVIRGGLQALPRGQYEAAKSLGMGYWRMHIFVILPQALKLVIPGIANTFLALVKDTPLIFVVGLLEIVGMLNLAKTNPEWLGFAMEGYVFAAIIFWIICYAMSKYSYNLEQKYKTDR